ncbi:putative ABC transporter ATP-binding protein [Reticulibacter mediterranei]|uniref:Putative ABC transporter ATP-binding protein n=1 Tax=Reticulibacter mediterranei TaxID=2778369 RepID=A0A8J3MY88_9CHLR|nr:ABC transporter ATP-binding protein [Reticulibacter mediterranei]GHO90652.1 putative ABC transporter ATP-binding protein [Reticulibacter mediterranei]
MVGFLYRNLKGHRLIILIATMMTCLQVMADLLAPFPLKFIIDKVKDNVDPSLTYPFLGNILDFFDTLDTTHRLMTVPPGKHSTFGIILFATAMLLIFNQISALLTYLQMSIATIVGQNLTLSLRRQLFGHLQLLPLGWHSRQKKGDLVQRVVGDITNIEKLVTDGLIDLLAGILTVLGVSVIMLLIDWRFTMLAILLIPALFLLILKYTFSIKQATKKASWATGQVAHIASENIGAITEVKAFTMEQSEAKRFAIHTEKNREVALRAGILQAQFTPLVAIMVALGTTFIIGIGAYVAAISDFVFWFLTIEQGRLTIGTLVVFLTYLKMLYQPMRNLSKLASLATLAASGTERLQEVLNQTPEVDKHFEVQKKPVHLRGHITYENVFFGYTKDQTVLKGIHLHIPAGRKIALVGLSGSGKTTLVNLLLRFYEVQHGCIKIDSVNIKEFALTSLRQNVSLMSQDSVLFEGTLRNNIEIGQPDASLDQIINAAKKARIHDFIMSMPLGYDTPVYEQGKNFSCGQRQRIVIARAILRDAPILILDEPTANLDVETEAEVMHALSILMANRTVLIVSHRLNILGSMDEILVLREGKIAERGTLNELRQKNGIFACMLAEKNRYNSNSNQC